MGSYLYTSAIVISIGATAGVLYIERFHCNNYGFRKVIIMVNCHAYWISTVCTVYEIRCTLEDFFS